MGRVARFRPHARRRTAFTSPAPKWSWQRFARFLQPEPHAAQGSRRLTVIRLPLLKAHKQKQEQERASRSRSDDSSSSSPPLSPRQYRPSKPTIAPLEANVDLVEHGGPHPHRLA